MYQPAPSPWPTPAPSPVVPGLAPSMPSAQSAIEMGVPSPGHYHAKNMQLYAEDALTHPRPWELWESKTQFNDWKMCIKNPEWDIQCDYRRIPKHIEINGHKVPKPLTVAPKSGEVYWLPSPLNVDHPYAITITWRGAKTDDRYLKDGLVHSSKENAHLHAVALLSFTKL